MAKGNNGKNETSHSQGYRMGNSYKNSKYSNKKGQLAVFNLARRNKYFKTKGANKRFLEGWRLTKKD